MREFLTFFRHNPWMDVAFAALFAPRYHPLARNG
jgi:hypothetical protein